LVKTPVGLTVSGVLLVSGLALGFFAAPNFFYALICYLAITFAYTFWLKRKVLVDCITLGVLYTLRVIAGGAVTGIAISFWLLAFSVFFFASLAWVKRYAELEVLREAGKDGIGGRGYLVRDMPVVLAFGTGSAFIAVLIFALYLDSEAVKSLYRVPEIGWIAIPLIMYLIGRTWFKANRGQMNEDPILFVLKDIPSLFTICAIAAALTFAHVGW
jgi:4-hydroxybenzoate polyprenyltransferase